MAKAKARGGKLPPRNLISSVLTVETLVVLGQFDLRVRRGEVTFLGATLRSSQTIHRVFISSTHSLPYIKCNSSFDRPQEDAEVEISNCNSGIQLLERIAPQFGRIWVGDAMKPKLLRGSRKIGQRSFEPVGDNDGCSLYQEANIL